MRRRRAVLVVGAIAAATVIGRAHGLALTLTVIALIAVTARRRDPWSIACCAMAAALACMATVRAAGWVVAPCLGAAVALAGASGTSWRQVIVGLVPRPSLDALRVLTVKPESGWRHPLTGAALAGAVLAVFVPLFATADAAFAHLLDELVPDPGIDDPAARIAVWLAFALTGGALLKARTAATGEPGTPRLSGVEWVAPLGALVALFAAFVALQVTTLYAGHEHVIHTAGLTYAEYAREGFAQLLVAAALTLAVIAAAARWAPRARLKQVLLGALCLLTLLVLASALTRLALYMEAYGFTRLRLTAQATILWLGGVFALIVVARGAAWLPRATVALTATALLAFAISDPDRRIAERNLAAGRVDERVLRGLSADAAPALGWRLAECPAPDDLLALNAGRSRARDALGCGP